MPANPKLDQAPLPGQSAIVGLDPADQRPVGEPDRNEQFAAPHSPVEDIGSDPAKPSDPPDGDGELFYEIPSGDRWLLVADTGGRRFVRHVPNRSSGGVDDVTDLQSFRDREPHSAQHQALESLLNKADQGEPLTASRRPT